MPISLTAQTLEVPGSIAIAGEGKPRRNAEFVEALTTGQEGINNLHENFLAGRKHAAGTGDYLGHRTYSASGEIAHYVWESYDTIYDRMSNAGAGFAKLGLPEKGVLGLFSVNRREWVISEHACYKYNYITVPLYDTLGRDAIQYIINQTDMHMVVATADKAKLLLAMRDSIPSVKHIIVMDPTLDPTLVEAATNADLTISLFTDIEASGKASPLPSRTVGLEDICTICYTSGTTGLPKGVVLTHGNLLAEAEAFRILGRSGQSFLLADDDVHISYLPLAHVLERVVCTIISSTGARIGFFQGDALKLLDDVMELKPTVFVSVPRLFNRIYDKVLASVKAKGGIAAFLFNRAYASKKAGLANGTNRHWLWDRLVFGTVRAKLGGRVRYVVTGSAPIAPDVMDFLRIALSADVHEGYGQTESTAAMTLTIRPDCESGHVGTLFPCCEVKLLDIPSMNYTSAGTPHPQGEILVRGNQIFREYWKDPEKTAESLDKDGWAHTGDVGMWDAKGRLVVIDRVKNIFKLAQGEYIAPDRIENTYQKHELISQCFVHGDSLQAALVGIIVPDPDALPAFAASHQLGGRSYEELCKEESLRKHILQQLIAFGKANDLKGFENVKNIRLESSPFTVEAGTLTPTFKLKRHEIKMMYLKDIEEMYREMA